MKQRSICSGSDQSGNEVKNGVTGTKRSVRRLITSILVRRGSKAWTENVQWKPSEVGSNVDKEKGMGISKSGQESEGEGDAGL